MSFWKGRKVLVTGASGFVGSHLVNRLKSETAEVVTLSKDESTSIEDLERLNEIVRDNKISIIFHLAAQSTVEIGQIDPVRTFEVNIRGTWNILEVARKNNIEKVIIASTVHVYGDNPNVPFKEEYFPQPSRPYETSKACADLLAQSYADTYNLPVEIPRFVNIYGPGDLNFTRLIPKVIKSILNNEQLEVWDIGSIRDFLYIDDAINAYLTLAEKQLDNGKRLRVFNFGTGKPIKVYDLVLKIIELVHKEISVKMETPPKERSHEIIKQYVSTAKAEKELGWRPMTSLEDGLAETIKWYKSNSHAL